MTYNIDLGTKSALQLCHDVELACAELYRGFTALFKDNGENFLLCLKEAMEEENQARQFVLLGKLHHSNVNQTMQIGLWEVKVTLVHINALIERIRVCPPSMEAALRIAIDLDSELNELMMGKRVHFSNQSFKGPLPAMADSGRLDSTQKAFIRIPAA